MQQNYTLDKLKNIDISLKKPMIVFLYGDLGSGKTTLSQFLISKLLKKDISATSPTYVYYNKYEDIYHFDLYRLRDYDEFISIGWEEILDNNEWIIIIEWPEIIEKYYQADIKIFLEKTSNPLERKINIVQNK